MGDALIDHFIETDTANETYRSTEISEAVGQIGHEAPTRLFNIAIFGQQAACFRLGVLVWYAGLRRDHLNTVRQEEAKLIEQTLDLSIDPEIIWVDGTNKGQEIHHGV